MLPTVGSFIVVTQYVTPDYHLEAQNGTDAGFLHPSGIRVALGETPDGSPACLAESNQHDSDMLGLLRLDVDKSLDEAGVGRVWAFSRKVREEHRSAAEDVVRVLRWLTRRDEGGSAIGQRQSARWSEDGAEWHGLRVGDPPLTDIGWGTFDLADSWRSAVYQLLMTGETEPLAHELLQEAQALVDTNPRSCLVIAVAALEVGLKRHVIRMGGTIRESSRGSDLVGLINQGLPGMRPERWKRPPRWLNSRLGEAVAARNRTVHSGASAPPRDQLVDIIRGVRDILYLCDWQYKHDWAGSYVSFPHGDTSLTGPKPVFRGRVQLV